MARKPGKKQKEKSVVCTGEGKNEKEIRVGRQEPPLFEFGGEVTHMRFSIL